jgi:hypothetical protein
MRLRGYRIPQIGGYPGMVWAKMARRSHFGFDSRVPAGVVIAAIGFVLTLLSYTAHGAWSVQRFWPLLVVGFGVMRVSEPSGRLAGWVLLLVGGGVLFSNLGLYALPSREVMRYWPLTVMLAGIVEMVMSRNVGVLVEGFAVLFLGAWLQWSYFGAFPIASCRPWPLVLAAVGAVMVWRGLH